MCYLLPNFQSFWPKASYAAFWKRLNNEKGFFPPSGSKKLHRKYNVSKMKAVPFFPFCPLIKQKLILQRASFPGAKCSCHVSAPVPKIMLYCLMSRQWSHWKQDSPRSHSFCKKTIYSLIWLLTLIPQRSLGASLSVLCFHLQLDSIHQTYCTLACLWSRQTLVNLPPGP